jgi:hypothetical protein
MPFQQLGFPIVLHARQASWSGANAPEIRSHLFQTIVSQRYLQLERNPAFVFQNVVTPEQG